MDTPPRLLSAPSESVELSPNVLSPHIDASLLLRRRSSFQFKFLSKVSELRDAIRHAVTFEKSSPNTASASKNSGHDSGSTINNNERRSSVTAKIDRAEEAIPCEKNNSLSSKAHNYVDKWTQTEDKYLNVASFYPVTPVSATKKKIMLPKSPINGTKDRQCKVTKSRELKDTSLSEIDTEALDASFSAEYGIINEKHVIVHESEMHDSVKSFLENERRAEEMSQDASFGEVKEFEKISDDEQNIAVEVDDLETIRANVLTNKILSSSVKNTTKKSEEESFSADHSLYYTDYPSTSEHIFEQSLRIYSPPCNKPKRSTSSPKFQDSGYDYLSSTTLSDDEKSVFNNHADFETEMPKKRMVTVPEEDLLNKTYDL